VGSGYPVGYAYRLTRRKKYFTAVIVLACLALWWFLSSPKHEVRYTVTNLSKEIGYLDARAYDINNQGDVLLEGGGRAFIWSSDEGSMRIPIDNVTRLSINDRRQVAGRLRDASDVNQVFFWEKSTGLHLIGPCGHPLPRACDLNNRGEVVWNQKFPVSRDEYLFTTHIWNPESGSVILAPTNSPVFGAIGINDSGHVLAFFNNNPNTRTPEIGIWSPAQEVQMLREINELPTGIFDIKMNDSGLVVGEYYTGGGEYCGDYVTTEGFYWDGNSLVPLFCLGGNTVTACEVNERGQIVGSSSTAWDERQYSVFRWISNMADGVGYRFFGERGMRFSYRLDPYRPSLTSATLWEDGNVYDLNYLISPWTGWELVNAYDINDSGQIVGRGYHKGKESAFLLTPIGDVTKIPSN